MTDTAEVATITPTDHVTNPPTVREIQEAGPLARELASVFRSIVDYEKECLARTAPEALAKVEVPVSSKYEANVLRGPADRASWSGLEAVVRKDPEAVARRWEEIKREALDELQSGYRAAKAMESYFSTPWKRAQFLAIRQDLADEWQPRNGIERQLIDTMAQAQTSMLFWQERLNDLLMLEHTDAKQNYNELGKWLLPRVKEDEAVDQAGAMVDRFNRIFLRTLRALRDLRRYTPPVIVQNARQVNVGGQQVNVAAAGLEEPGSVTPSRGKGESMASENGRRHRVQGRGQGGENSRG
jgi:hypothetical protein